MENIFYERKKEYEELNKRLNKNYNIISNIRFLMVVLIIYFGYKAYDSREIIFYILEVLLVAGFLVLLYNHGRIREKRLRSEILIRINENYIKRVQGDWTGFEDRGDEFLDLDHNYANDLDIVGDNSLFQFINVANTHTGRDRKSVV